MIQAVYGSLGGTCDQEKPPLPDCLLNELPDGHKSVLSPAPSLKLKISAEKQFSLTLREPERKFNKIICTF